MKHISYARYRFPPAIIQHAVWLYFRFPLSFRDVEDMLAERGIDVSYESVRRWSVKFGLAYVQSPLCLGHLLSVSLNGFGHWWAHAEGLMWSDVIVLPEPLVDDDLSLLCG